MRACSVEIWAETVVQFSGGGTAYWRGHPGFSGEQYLGRTACCCGFRCRVGFECAFLAVISSFFYILECSRRNDLALWFSSS